MNLFELFVKIGADTSQAEKGMKSTEKNSETLTNKIKVMSAQFEAAQKNVDKLTQEFNESVSKTGAASKETQELAKKLDDAEKEAEQAKKALDKYNDEVDEIPEKAEEAKKGVGNLSSWTIAKAQLMADAIKAAGKAIIGFAKDSIKAGADFDESMSQVAATMGVTVSEIENLRDFAQQMGSTTAFSATQAADALNYMALAGYDAETSMNMLPNVLNLAAAGGIELAYASDMVTDAQSALGLSLDETAAMVDKMAKASSKTNTSVQQMGEAILTVGGTAKNLKGGTTELAQVLGLLADNGIKGAEGGTHLRNILLAMEPTTDAAAAAFEKLNLQTYDANGSLRNLEDIFLDMNAAMDGMTDQEKQNIITAIFNKTDIASVNALLATTEERWDAVSAAIDDSAGAAQAMANTQLDNLNGDITLFKSALEGAQIAISDKLTPTLRGFVQFGSKGLSELTEGFKEGGLSGAMDAFGYLLGEGLTMIAESLPEIVKAGVSLIEALITGISENGDLIITAAFDAVMVLADGILNMLPQIVKLGLDLIVSLANGIAESLPELIPTITSVVLQIVETLTNPDTLSQLLNAAISIITSLSESLLSPDAMNGLIVAVVGIINNLATFFISNLGPLLSAAISIIVALAEYLVSPDSLGTLVEAAIQIIVALASAMVSANYELINAAFELIAQLIETFTNGDWESIGKNILDGIKTGISNAWANLKEWFGGLFDDLIGTAKKILGIASPSKVFKKLGSWTAEGFGIGWDDEFANVTKDIENSLDFGGYDYEVVYDGDGSLGGMLSGIGGARGVTVVQNIYSEAKTAADLMQEAIYQQERAVFLGV